MDEIPLFLQPYTNDHYRVDSFTVEGAEGLLRAITGQAAYIKPRLGNLVRLPPRVESRGEPSWRLLPEPAPVLWMDELFRQSYRPQKATVELHLAPAEPRSLLGLRRLQQLAEELAGLGRAKGLFTQRQGLEIDFSDQAAWAYSKDWRTGEAGLLVHRRGQRTCWFNLPDAKLGWILDEADLAKQLTRHILALLRIAIEAPDELAPAIGLEPTTTVRIGHLSEASATSASFPMGHRNRVRIDPVEALSVHDLQARTASVADELVAGLAQPFRL
ncbi:hypothetical protein FPZ12_014050 [Amycolatopsis acidicola]|uniref:Uncharacterized protein n=1 Tax=Amycolatopsis acidicola TaxID=2596893 RepID=A0A5N0V5H7_9PSEU|nr:hypothetical protein [Amycolatopsis acidicola]KAA9161626.1 hypothetical protein FPZ12_014050 [Amycolatopsis acidicola]